jgi:E3 ubiquitin-protein ligase HERC2
MTPTQSFLTYTLLPNDEETLLDIKKAAVFVMSHLDRLAVPYNPPPAFCRVKYCKSDLI